jgi:hypothetical protein
MVLDGIFENRSNTNGENQGDEFDIESLLEAPYQKKDVSVQICTWFLKLII